MADASRSGLHAVGTALLLAGGVVSFVLGLVFAFVGWTVAGPLALGVSLLLVAGGVLSLLAWRQARAGNPQKAFVLGLIAGLLPPVQLLCLLGAILVRLAPDFTAPATPTG